MKRIVAASLSLLFATAFIAPGAAAQSSTAADAQPKTGTSETKTPSASESAKSSTSKSTEKSTSESTARKPVRDDVIPIPVLEDGEFDVDYATQISYVHVPTGFRADSENAEEIRTCLSICKIYIADHVFREGSEKQREQAAEMLETSDDGISTRLYRAFPDAIDEVAERYDLKDTDGARTWGKSVTTMHDVATFLAAKVEAGDFEDPVLAALADAAPVAADGYDQDFGSAVLPGVIGTKWGWADKRDTMNASASYGRDFAMAVNVIADADTTTEVVEGLFTTAPRGEFVVEDGELVPKAAVARQTAASADDAPVSSGDWVAGALLVGSAAAILWVLRGRNR